VEKNQNSKKCFESTSSQKSATQNRQEASVILCFAGRCFTFAPGKVGSEPTAHISHDGSMGLVYYTQMKTIQINYVNAGKYTSPMDPLGMIRKINLKQQKKQRIHETLALFVEFM